MVSVGFQAAVNTHWSANPLNATLATVQTGQLAHSPGRCMLSVHQRHQWSNQEVYPTVRQRSIYRAQRTVRFILAILWVLAVLATAWPITVTLVVRSLYSDSYPDARFPFQFCWDNLECSWSSVTLGFSPAINSQKVKSAPGFTYAAQAVLCVLFACLVQAIQTIGLHCVELLVNLSRDESIWRKAYGNGKKAAPGARLRSNPLMAAVSSWENIVLFFAKAVLHWIMGQAMVPSLTFDFSEALPALASEQLGGTASGELDYSDLGLRYGMQMQMSYPRLFVYAALAILFAVFATFLAFRRRRGYQPAAMGHLPTLANLVDDWRTDDQGRLWWGDKSTEMDARSGTMRTRHAGTSPNKAFVGPIHCDALYAGRERTHQPVWLVRGQVKQNTARRLSCANKSAI